MKRRIVSLMMVAVMVMALGVTAMAFDFGSESEYVGNQTFFTNEDTAGADLTGLDRAVIYATANDLNWGWNNGNFYVWCATNDQVNFGGENASNVDVLLTETGDFTAELAIDWSGSYFMIGYGVYATTTTAFSVEKVELYAGSELLGTWTAGATMDADGTWEEATEETTTEEATTEEATTEEVTTEEATTEEATTEEVTTEEATTEEVTTEEVTTEEATTEEVTTEAVSEEESSTGVAGEETGDATPFMAVVAVLAISAMAIVAVSAKKVEE